MMYVRESQAAKECCTLFLEPILWPHWPHHFLSLSWKRGIRSCCKFKKSKFAAYHAILFLSIKYALLCFLWYCKTWNSLISKYANNHICCEIENKHGRLHLRHERIIYFMCFGKDRLDKILTIIGQQIIKDLTTAQLLG